jgi:hypothetical protein
MERLVVLVILCIPVVSCDLVYGPRDACGEEGIIEGKWTPKEKSLE